MKIGSEDIKQSRIYLPAPSIVAGKIYISLLYWRYLVRLNQMRPVPLPMINLYVCMIIELLDKIILMPTIWSALLRMTQRVQ